MKNNLLTRGVATLGAIALLLPLAVAQGRTNTNGFATLEGLGPAPGETKQLIPLQGRIKITHTDMRRMFPRINNGAGARGLKPSNPGVPTLFNEGAGSVNLPVGGTNFLTTVKFNSKFPGLNFTGWVPPDTSMAVGTNHVVQVVNSSIGVFNKSNGQLLLNQQFTNTGFLAGTGAGSFTFDPRVIFDPDTGKFVVVVLDVNDSAQTSKVHLCVSDTGDPTGSWTIATIDNTLTSGGNKFWGDYPTVTTTTDSYLLTFNHFGFTAGGAFGTLFAVSKNFATVEFLPTNQFSVSLAKQVTPGNAKGHGIGIRMPGNGNNPGANVFEVTKSGGTTSLSAKIVTLPVFLPQGSGASMKGIKIDALGDRMMDVSQTGNSLVFGITVNIGPDNLGLSWPTSAPEPNHTKVRWGEIDITNFAGSGPTLVQAGDLAAEGEDSMVIPAIIMNTVGDIGVVATLTGPNITPRIVAASRRSSDPLGSLSVPQEMAASNNFNISGGGTSRWGDYAGIGVDPNNGTTFWGSHELFTNASLSWRTEFFSFITQAAGGGGTIPVGTVTPIFGTLDSGNITSFEVKGDNNWYKLNSEFIDTRGGYAGYDISFPVESQPNTARANFTVRCNADGVSGFAYVYNFRLQQFVLTNSFRLRSGEGYDFTAYMPTKSSASDFYGPEGEMIFRVIAFTSETRSRAIPPPFLFETDFGQLITN